MAKATKKCIPERDIDLEDNVLQRTKQVAGLAALINHATVTGHYDPERMGAATKLLDELATEAAAAAASLVSVVQTLVSDTHQIAAERDALKADARGTAKGRPKPPVENGNGDGGGHSEAHQ